MSSFLDNNRADLIARCAAKVAKRPTRNASQRQLETGIPIFLEQLIQTLDAESDGDASEGVRISGPAGGEHTTVSEIRSTAMEHGKALLALEYTFDQVVHDYGDLCQAITDLAVERDAPFSIEEYRTLNRCLDNAIAAAVTEFSTQRDIATQLRQTSEGNQRLGYLMHELRNALSSGMLAAAAMKAGNLSVGGATGSVLQRSHAAMARIINRALDEVKADNAQLDTSSIFAVDEFIREAHEAGQLDAEARGLKLVALEVDPGLVVEAHRDLLLGALTNLIGNALKFTLPNTTVTLTAHAVSDRVFIEVSDHCGGLRQGDAERIFIPFSQRGDDKTGLGLGLSIARESVHADGGTLTVRNLPGHGCVFTINLPIRLQRAW
ncbi:HAMP domain-containing histidine kinase [Massilia forsythiae]|uniref:histidine kinase n=1 Tax=Massilia forsythiae TaxID=2728020 RepID=A0A7Z2W290_9BURK|nr:HAMP domain-containing histidine kinase [Massilia forsythiae]